MPPATRSTAHPATPFDDDTAIEGTDVLIPSSPILTPKPVLKHNKIPYCSGKADEVHNFGLTMKERLDHDYLRDTAMSEKVQWFAGHLVGSAASWYQGMRDKKDPCLLNLETAVDELTRHFGDNRSEDHAQAKLYNLRMTGKATVYSAEFLRLRALCDINDKVANFFYWGGLSEKLKDKIAPTRPKNLKDLIDLANNVDEDTNYIKLPPTIHFAHTTSNPYRASFEPRRPDTSSPASGSNRVRVNYPARVGATVSGRTRGPLTPAERQERIEKNLCMVCASASHQREACPLRRDNRGQRVGQSQLGKANPQA